MNPDFIREMTVYADGEPLAPGCRLHLTGGRDLSLKPGLFQLMAYDLTDSSITILSRAKMVEVRSGYSILASGEVCDSHTSIQRGRRITEVAFAPGMTLWKSACSITLSPGLKVTDAIKAVLQTLPSPGLSLTGFTGRNIALSRSQVFFGRTADAVTLLADTAEGEAYLGPAGLIVSGRDKHDSTLVLTSADLLSAPSPASGCVILNTRMTGWPEGSWVKYSWSGITGEGRLISRTIDADTSYGVWRSELLVEKNV